jgi:hypothetical protein
MMSDHTNFKHRIITGWISDFSSIPRWEPWPSITLDQCMTDDIDEAMRLAEISGYTGVMLYGLLAGRAWNPYLPDTASPQRKQQVLALMDRIRERGLTVLHGLGLYSWGFDAIIAAQPEVDGGSPSTMCGTRSESWAWMQRVIDFVFDEYDPDGVSMQSADMGRCPCDDCQALGALEYHARINEKVSGYIRSRWPEKMIHISTWGMDLGNPAEQQYVLQLARHADVLNDFNNSAARGGRANRQALIAALSCPYGTEQGFWFDPPPFWDRLKWFLPLSLRNVPYWQDLKADGGDAIERFILPLINPGADVSFIFDGLMMQDLRRDPTQTLEEALSIVFEPGTTTALNGLADVWQNVEAAFIDHLPRPTEAREIHSSRVHYAHPTPSESLANRPEYLLTRRTEALTVFRDSLQRADRIISKLHDDLGQREKALRLMRSIRNTLVDIDRVLVYRY